MDEPHVMDLFRLEDRVALITGGTKGLGRSIAHGLAQAGATIVVCSRHQEDCDRLAAEIEATYEVPSRGEAADVTEPAQVEELVTRTHDTFGRLDILVNCAGINLRHPMEEFPLDQWQQVVDVNLKGTWLCCRAVAPVMKQQRRGSVINLGSTLSAVGLADRSAYCPAKHAVVGLTKTLALEWAPFGVRCNALCPGPFLTEMNRPLLRNPELVEAVVGRTALNRWGELYEIRGAALFLAADASSYVTGTTLYVDGGWTAG